MCVIIMNIEVSIKFWKIYVIKDNLGFEASNYQKLGSINLQTSRDARRSNLRALNP